MIDVVLATYKPDAEMLKAQVDSIQAQRGVDVNLICREDTHGEGACANFAALLSESRAEYVAFADQDDVWFPDKLAKSMAKMRELEGRWGKEVPLCVFTDAKVVDAGLNVLHESLFKFTNIDPCRDAPRQLALQNVANGNTMLVNAALRDLAMPIPQGAFMHDHWMLLVASSFGHIACLHEPTLLYRQHDGNVLGAACVGWRYYWHRFRQGRKALRERLYANIRQAEAFTERFGCCAPRELRALSGLGGKCRLVRVMTLIRHRIAKCGLLRNLGTWLIV